MTTRPMQLRVFGMRRSGNHAVIDWLRRNMGETVFLNDCAPGDPFETYALMETPQGDEHGPSFRRTRWFPQFPEGREARSHVVSYEDVTPEETGPPEGWGTPFRTLVIHRSFLNWLASFFALVTGRQRGTLWGVEDPAEIAPYRATYARLLFVPDATAISYDRWLEDPAYRTARLAALGLEARDNGTGATSHYGGGSSFEGGDRTRRWARLADDDDFLALARGAAGDTCFMGALAPHYPEDAERLRRLAAGGSLHDEVREWSN